MQVDEYNTLQNAVMATKDSSETADLNAYISDAKAVLMSDAKTTVNTGDSTSPEPSDTQDPCDENVNLTINKVWKDFRNNGQSQTRLYYGHNFQKLDGCGRNKTNRSCAGI